MALFTKADITSWERFYRANVLSALSGCKAAMLVGSANKAGQHNLALFQNIVHLGANPALIGMINRPETATPHTLHNIRETGWYTLSAVTTNMIAAAHQCSAKYPIDTDEFEAVGLSKILMGAAAVPAVQESPVQALLSLVEIVPITHNNTWLIIGEVQAFSIADGLIAADGFVDMIAAGMVCTIGLDGYAAPQLLQRFAYAKPGSAVVSLP